MTAPGKDSKSESKVKSPPQVTGSSPAAISADAFFKVVYDVDEKWLLPMSFDMKSFPGAMEIVLIGEPNTKRRLITTWKDQESFKSRAQDAFETFLHLNSPTYAGFVMQDLKVKSLWTRFGGIYALLVSIIAILSNMEMLHRWVANSIRMPETIVYPKDRKLIVTAGIPVEVEFRLQNRTDGRNVVRINEMGTGG